MVALLAATIACSDRDNARAFDFFGLWGSDESTPPVSPTAISYARNGRRRGRRQRAQECGYTASSLYKLRKDAPRDGDALARRAENDFGPIIDAMWAAATTTLPSRYRSAAPV